MKIFICILCLAIWKLAYTQTKPSHKDFQTQSIIQTNQNTHIKNKFQKKQTHDHNKKSDMVNQKINSFFEDLLKILKTESIDSKPYRDATFFLKKTFYNSASFETLKKISKIYQYKKDFTNQMNILNLISYRFPKKAESFYLLGLGYKQLFNTSKKNKEKNKKKSIEQFNKALTIDKKWTPAYLELLTLLKTKSKDTEQVFHTKESLGIIVEMLENLEKNKGKYYIDLCKAYYDTKYFQKSQQACKKAKMKNPSDPISHFILAITPLQNNNKREKELLKTAEKFRNSFFVQYNTALYFKEKIPKRAIFHFDLAYKINPESLALNKIMSTFFLKNGEEEKSYKHFLKACLLTKGKYIKEFKNAKNYLKRKALVDLILKFQKGINYCYKYVKSKKQNKN